MTIYGDFHTHTVFSHGKGTMEENVQAAIDRGLSAVAITDHGLSHFAYGISKRELQAYLSEVDRLRDCYADRIRGQRPRGWGTAGLPLQSIAHR